MAYGRTDSIFRYLGAAIGTTMSIPHSAGAVGARAGRLHSAGAVGARAGRLCERLWATCASSPVMFCSSLTSCCSSRDWGLT